MAAEADRVVDPAVGVVQLGGDDVSAGRASFA
jgi:hypothetical protein